MKHTMKSLKQLLMDNKIEYAETSKKTQLLFQAIDGGLLKREDVFPSLKPINPKYERLRKIRTHPKKVIYRDMETGETIIYDSVYKAMKATGHGHHFFRKPNGKYEIQN